MKDRKIFLTAVIAAVLSVLTVILGIAAGSVFITPEQIIRIFGKRLFGIPADGVFSKWHRCIIILNNAAGRKRAWLYGFGLSE